MAAYGVQAYSDLPACESEVTQTDVSYTVKRTFQTCFLIHTAQFLQSTFLSRLFVLMPFASGSKISIDHKLASKLAIIDSVTEHVLRLAVCLMIIWQSTIVFKPDFDDCFHQDHYLGEAENMMLLLVVLEVLFSAIFFMWSLYLMSFDQILQKLRNQRCQEGLDNFYGNSPRGKANFRLIDQHGYQNVDSGMMTRQKSEEEELMIREAERQRALREEMAIDLYRERRNPYYQQARRVRAGRQEASRPRSDTERRRLTFGASKAG